MPSLETRRAQTRHRAQVVDRCRLTVTVGPDRGLVGLSGVNELTIGSEQGCELRLTDPAVSRHHCTVTSTPAGLLLRDIGSKNGTYLDGVRIESAYLRPGSTITIGDTTVVAESLEASVEMPLADADTFGRLLGSSPAMRRIFALLPRIAASDSTVLIQGETGTGKGLIAEAIHSGSARARGPLVVLDCSAIPPTLIESELFGHEKGAFTGAHCARQGAFEAARGGTVFLDEIGELPLDMQPKLLRALEERMIKRIGSQEPVRLDVRVIAATNRDLRHEVNRGSFRSDLFYRLNIVHLRVPALRERPEDIPMLIGHFYRQFVGEADAAPPAEVVAWLARQSWPGNVRELRSAVERAVLLGESQLWGEVCADAVAAGGGGDAAGSARIFDPTVSFRHAKEREISAWERWYVRELVRRAGGNLSRAAREARMDRNYLRELLRRHGVQSTEE